MAALECGVDTLLAAEPLGGMAALRAKSLALTTLFIAQVREEAIVEVHSTVMATMKGAATLRAPIHSRLATGNSGRGLRSAKW